MRLFRHSRIIPTPAMQDHTELYFVYFVQSSLKSSLQKALPQCSFADYPTALKISMLIHFSGIPPKCRFFHSCRYSQLYLLIPPYIIPLPSVIHRFIPHTFSVSPNLKFWEGGTFKDLYRGSVHTLILFQSSFHFLGISALKPLVLQTSSLFPSVVFLTGTHWSGLRLLS